MKRYLDLYRWAMSMKLRMAMYTFVALFLKSLCQLLDGKDSILIEDALSMWGCCLLFAVVESWIFPEERECTKIRSLLWLGAANLCFLGGALLFGWFDGVPVWGGVLLIVFLEWGLGMMWFGDRFVLKMDSAQLTQALKRYQRRENGTTPGA